MIIELQKRNLEFIYGYEKSKLKNLCETFELSTNGNRAELLRVLSKAILERKVNFYRDVVDDLLHEQDKSDEINI